MASLRQTRKNDDDDGCFVGESYLNFLDGIRAKDSVDTYKKSLRRFCRFVKMDTDSIIELANRDNKAALSIFKTLIRHEKERCEKGEIQPSTVNTPFYAIKLFFEMNDILFNWKKLRKMLPEMQTLEDRAYTKEEIQRLLDHADLREKVIGSQ